LPRTRAAAGSSTRRAQDVRLAHVEPEALEAAFVEIRPLLGHCRFRDCRHDREPGCAVQEAVIAGRVAPFRVALLHRLVAESQRVRNPAR
jgi:ribosome biogenesis GTPase